MFVSGILFGKRNDQRMKTGRYYLSWIRIREEVTKDYTIYREWFEDRIIAYDNSDVISSCRCWYTFIFFGHNPNLVSVLNGGLLKWKNENRDDGGGSIRTQALSTRFFGTYCFKR